MAIADKNLGPTDVRAAGSLTLTAGNETARLISPSGISKALLKGLKLADRVGPAIVYRPIGFIYILPTATSVTAAVLTLRRNGVSIAAATGTIPIQAINANEQFVAFPDFSATIGVDAAGDNWSLLVTTTSTTGVANPVYLVWAEACVPGINVGVDY